MKFLKTTPPDLGPDTLAALAQAEFGLQGVERLAIRTPLLG